MLLADKALGVAPSYDILLCLLGHHQISVQGKL